MIQPQNDRVLIQRIEEPSDILLTDRPKSIKGLVLAVGPGKWIEGTWWYLKKRRWLDGPMAGLEAGEWEWIPGHRQEMTVKPGMKVLFNSKWNDFSAGENKGTGADFSGPLERPLPLKANPLLHLVQEADIFAIVENFDFHASMNLLNATEQTWMRTIELPANGHL